MNKSSLREKLSNSRSVAMLVTAVTFFALTIPAHADIPVKFFGDLVPNQLSPKYAKVVEKFFENDPRERNTFACFEGKLLSLFHGRQVGVGVDCLNLGMIDDFTEGLTLNFGFIENTINASVAIDAVTFFFFRGGIIVSDGNTSVRPFFQGVGNGDSSPDEGSVTHMTGSVPGKTPTIVAATGIYRKLKNRGNVRLSGAVNLGLDDGRVFFSCIFVVQKGDQKGKR